MNNMKYTVLITSADKFIGHRCAEFMLKQKNEMFQKILVGCMDRRHVQDLEKLGAEAREYDPRNFDSLEKAFHGADHVFIIPPLSSERFMMTKNMIDVCKKMNVNQAMLCSALGADLMENEHTILNEFYRLEQHLMKSGIQNHYIIRLSFLQQQFLLYAEQIQMDRKLKLPIEQGKFAPVNLNDVCAAVCMLVCENKKFEQDKGHNIFCLTGPEAMDGHHLAMRLNQAVNEKIEFESISREEAEKILRKRKELDESEVYLILEIYDLVRQNKLSMVTDDLRRILHKEPENVDQFFRKHASQFRPRRD